MDKGKILVADDDNPNLESVCGELEREGFTVFGAVEPEEIFDIAGKERPDIVFIDLVMQGMNGVEICRKVKEIALEADVVLLSGFPQEIERSLMDFIKAGGRDEYLRKPLFNGEITESAEKIMGEKRGKI
ncbi:MAG: response regulator [Candidatus Omnitrophota bacterium]|jgi:PleD family two-component response regulator